MNLKELKERKEELENLENKEEFKEYIDDTNEEVEINGLTWFPSEVLENIDLIAFDEFHKEFNDDLMLEVEEQIDALESGENDV